MMFEIHIKRVNLFIEKECVTWRASGCWVRRVFSPQKSVINSPIFCSSEDFLRYVYIYSAYFFTGKCFLEFKRQLEI